MKRCFLEERCYSCNRRLKKILEAITSDGQKVYVGPECQRKIIQAGKAGYQPPLGGPKLYPLKSE